MPAVYPTLDVKDVEPASDYVLVTQASTGIQHKMTFSDFARIVLPTPALVVTAATYDLVRTDAGRHIRFTRVAGCTVTFPNEQTESIPMDYIYTFEQAAAGAVTFAAASGVTLNYHADFTAVTAGPHACVQARKVGPNEWLLVGLLATV